MILNLKRLDDLIKRLEDIIKNIDNVLDSKVKLKAEAAVRERSNDSRFIANDE
jgi:hypothetical protein